MSLTTTARVKEHLRIPAAVTTHDALISSIVAGIDQAVLDRCGQAAITQSSHEDRHSVWDSGLQSLGLDAFPVVSVAALTIDGVAQTEGTDFYVERDAGYLHLKTSTFPLGVDVVQCSYTAGLTGAALAQVEVAVTAWAGAKFNQAPHHGFQNESMDRYRYALDLDDAPAPLREAVARLTRALW